MLPFPSSYVQVTTVGQAVVIGKVTSGVPVIVPAQASVVVGAVHVIVAQCIIANAISIQFSLPEFQKSSLDYPQ